MNTNLGNVDGISRDQNGYYYLAAWGNNRLNRIAPDFSGTPQALSQTLFSPADIDIKWDVIDTAGIPNSSNNTVTYLPLSSTANVTEIVVQSAGMNAFVDMTNHILIIDVVLPEETKGKVEVVNMEGKRCASQSFDNAFAGKHVIHLPINEAMKGMCVVRIVSEKHVLEQKIIF